MNLEEKIYIDTDDYMESYNQLHEEVLRRIESEDSPGVDYVREYLSKENIIKHAQEIKRKKILQKKEEEEKRKKFLQEKETNEIINADLRKATDLILNHIKESNSILTSIKELNEEILKEIKNNKK